MTLYRSFVAAVIGIGVVVTIAGTVPWQTQDPVRAFLYLGLAVVSSVMRWQLPQVVGTITANFVFVLLGILELSLSEALLLGCASTVAQLLIHRRDVKVPVTPVFHVANAAIAVTLAFRAYQTQWAGQTGPSLMPSLIAATVLYAMNTFPVAVVLALVQKQNLAFIWRECNFRLFPYYVAGAILAGVLHFLQQASGQSPVLLAPFGLVCYSAYHAYRKRNGGQKVNADDLAALHQRTIEALAMAIEAKELTAHTHLRRLQLYCVEIGKDLKLPYEQLEALRAAAVLHDIGKLAVPEHILSKPGRLTREEFEKVKIHPSVGADILERVRFPYPVAEIVRAHHEKWNGAGYPAGLKGEAIPMGARILGVADCLDALISDRPYHTAVTIEEAMSRLAAEAGVSFDPAVVKVFQKRYEDLEVRLLAQSAEPSMAIERQPARDSLFPEQNNGSKGQSAPPDNGHAYLDTIAAARQEAQVLMELSQSLGNSLQLDETLAVVSSGLRRLVPFDSLVMYIIRSTSLMPRYATGESTSLFLSRQLSLGQGVAGWVAAHGKPVLNGHPGTETGTTTEASRAVLLNSSLAVPLTSGKETLGVLMVSRRGFDAFNKDDLRVLLAISGKLGTFVDNALKYEQAAASASTDFLTGLPNARALNLQLENELARSHRQGSALTVLVADLDGFKDVNDRYGHLEGDAVLRAISRVLRDNCREYDFVARMGGDEFVLLLPGMGEADVVAKIAQLNVAVGDAGRKVVADSHLGLSIGQARYPVDGRTAEQLLAEADQRMYAAKTLRKMRSGRSGSGPRGFDFDWEPTSTPQ